MSAELRLAHHLGAQWIADFSIGTSTVRYVRSMVVSIPEKTLEHWASIYLTYRYRSKASLWWPARGEDIYIGNLPPVPGKAVQLELKTTTLNPNGDVHKVKIDLGQLERYSVLPHFLQPFYVFPMPRWIDTLENATAAVGIPVSELGFSRADSLSAKSWWFANWMVALPTSRVGNILATEVAAYKGGGAGNADLVTISYKTGRRARPMWADRQSHRTIPWQSLWTRLEGCGAASWPQVAQLPSWISADRTRVDHRELRSLLADSQFDQEDDLTTWGSDGEGGFVRVAGELAQRPSDSNGPARDRRIAVGLSLKALQLG